ncbi:MAG: ParB N-terminal domain-containing protein [Candidatus Tectomicrobia bacterium]|uniref:ParB N-terminal domain-containing protein n=1 Tax=Tectimicrobiota bacterium TaxID=2528274 RepID=A0A933LQC8_UNCTE|nr:ParB N-terminal domain-containing protein [Candidatus Tectomicrobia bacterium]
MLEVKEICLNNLRPWEDNPRANDHAIDAVAESIRSFGFNVPILCDQNLTIIAGHTRWKAAKKLGMGKVPVIVVQMTDTQRQAFAIADNKTAEIADWDFPKLKEMLEELRSEDVDIKSLGFSEEELRELLNQVSPEHNMSSHLSKGYVEGIEEIDPLKLAYRLESICHCPNRNLAIDLFSGQGRLSFWYKRLFRNVVRVDKKSYDGIDYCQKAESFLLERLGEFMDFDFVDFDDAGCPGKELQLFFSLIENKKKPFILCLTDGMGLALKVRGKINLYDKYLFGKDKLLKIKDDSQYRDFDQYVKHLIDALCTRHGFNHKVLNWYRGADGNVIYAGFEITPNADKQPLGGNSDCWLKHL